MKETTRKKVLIIVENLPVPLDRRVWQEARSLHAAGYAVTVLCPRMKGYLKGSEMLDGIRILRHPMTNEARNALQYIGEYACALFWETLYTLYIFCRYGFGIVQACNPPDLIFLVVLPYKLFAGVRFVFDQHDGNPEIWVAKGGSKNDLFYRLLLFFERLSFLSADAVMTVNEPYRHMARTRGKVADDKLFVVRNSPKIPGTSTGSAEAELSGKIIAGYLGVMGKQDGVENLLESLQYILNVRKRTDVFLKLMGTGPELETIKDTAARLGIADHVIFTGWISGEEYIRQLSSCTVCVNADMVNEYNNFCSPNKVYEYMYFGKPIVQFPMTENSYQAEGACVFAKPNDYADMGEQILRLADDRQLCATLGAAGKKRFHETFSWERSERELLKAYASLVFRSCGKGV